jgi:hypothetical protein
MDLAQVWLAHVAGCARTMLDRLAEVRIAFDAQPSE